MHITSPITNNIFEATLPPFKASKKDTIVIQGYLLVQDTKETIKMENGKEYPVIKVEVSSASHPFFTGKKLFVDTAGRVEKFKNKYQKKA